MGVLEQRKEYIKKYNKVIDNLVEAINKGYITEEQMDWATDIINSCGAYGYEYERLADAMLDDGAVKMIKYLRSKDEQK